MLSKLSNTLHTLSQQSLTGANVITLYTTLMYKIDQFIQSAFHKLIGPLRAYNSHVLKNFSYLNYYDKRQKGKVMVKEKIII